MSFFNRLIESIRLLFTYQKKERAVKQSERMLKVEEHEEKKISLDLTKEEQLEFQDENIIDNLSLISNTIAAILKELKNQDEEGYHQYLEQLAHDEGMLKKQLSIFLQQLKTEQEYEEDATRRIEQIQKIGEQVSQLGSTQNDIDAGAIKAERDEITTHETEDRQLQRIEEDKSAIQQHLEKTLRSLITTLCATLRVIPTSDEEELKLGVKQAEELYAFLVEEKLLLHNVVHWTKDERAAMVEQAHHTKELELIERSIEAQIKQEEERKREDAGAEL